MPLSQGQSHWGEISLLEEWGPGEGGLPCKPVKTGQHGGDPERLVAELQHLILKPELMLSL